MENLTNLTIAKIHAGLKNKDFSAQELAKAHLNNIKEKDKDINSYLTVVEDLALSQAKEVDEKIAKGGVLDALAGVPCAVKDNILVEGVRCTAASKILENYVAPYDATVVKKIRDKGAVILGKANMDEFAMGASGENSAFGPTKNPRDTSRVPGGSSSGPAAAVAADMAVFALGSDTAGSIRYPASFCGLVGLRPTYGAVSRYGLIAMASSLDTIGPLVKTVEDCEIVFDAIKGYDEMDSASVNSKFKNPASAKATEGKQKSKLPARLRLRANSLAGGQFKIENLRIGVPQEYFVKGIDPEVEKIIKNAINKYKEAGAKIEEVSLPHTDYSVAAYYIITPSEISANVARYDGIKYGCSKSQNQGAQNLLDVYLQSRGEGFGPEVKRRIMLGTYALSAGYYEAYYLRAQKVRTLIRQDFEKVFKKVDCLMTPVSPFPAFKIGEKAADPLAMYLCDIFTGPLSLAGMPALSLPVGEVGGLPVGLQIIGKPFEENVILETGKFFEKLN